MNVYREMLFFSQLIERILAKTEKNGMLGKYHAKPAPPILT